MEAHIAEVTETTSQVWDRGQSASVKAAARRPLPRVTTLAISAGILVCATGFGLIAFTWSRVAGTLNVALQLPFFVSGGLTGLGLIRPDALGLKYRQLHLHRLQLDGGLQWPHAPATQAIGLGDDKRDVVARFAELAQAGTGKHRRAGEDNTQSRATRRRVPLASPALPVPPCAACRDWSAGR